MAFATGYLVGSVPLGLLVSWATIGVDIRRLGTGNIGAANIRRNVGLFPAAVVALGIFLQGLVPTLVVYLAGGSEAAVGGAAIGAVVGYGWPLFLGFQGGRAVGIATGAAAVISPVGFVVLLFSYALGAAAKQVALGVLLGFIAYAAYVFYSATSVADLVTSLLLVALLVTRRLEGMSRELKRNDLVTVLVERLLFDRRPGQRLVGSVVEEHRDGNPK